MDDAPLSSSTCFSTCSGTLNQWNSGKIYAKTAYFFAEIRENSVNRGVFKVPYKQGVLFQNSAERESVNSQGLGWPQPRHSRSRWPVLEPVLLKIRTKAQQVESSSISPQMPSDAQARLKSSKTSRVDQDVRAEAILKVL